MSDQNNYDISHVQVPDSFIQEILSETEPLKEAREEVHPQEPQAQAPIRTSGGGEVIELLSLLFEQFEQLNARLDNIQESVNEMTTVGGNGVGYSTGKQSQPTRRRRKGGSPECDAQAELEGKRHNESRDSLASILARRMRR